MMDATKDNGANSHTNANDEVSATIAGNVEGNTGSTGTATETAQPNEDNIRTDVGAATENEGRESQEQSEKYEFFRGRTLEHRTSFISGHEIHIRRPDSPIMVDFDIHTRRPSGGSSSNRNSVTFVGEFLQAARFPSGTVTVSVRNSVSSIQSTASTIIPSSGRNSDVTESDMDRSFTSATTRSSGSGHTIMPTASGSNIPDNAVFGSVADRRSAFLGRDSLIDVGVPGPSGSSSSSDNTNDKSPSLKCAISSFLPPSFIRPLQYKMSPRVEATITEVTEGDGIRLSIQSFLALESAFGDADMDDEGLGDRTHGPTAEDIVYYAQVMTNLVDNGTHPKDMAIALNRILQSQILVKLNTNGHSLYFRAVLHLLRAEIDNPRWIGDESFYDPFVKLNHSMECLDRLRKKGLHGDDEVYVKMLEERAQKIAIDWEIKQNRVHQEAVAQATAVAGAKKPGRREVIKARLNRVKGAITGLF